MTLSSFNQSTSFSSPSPHSPTPSLSSLSSISLSLSPLSSSSFDSSSLTEVIEHRPDETFGQVQSSSRNTTQMLTYGMAPKGKPNSLQAKNGTKRNAYKHVPHCLKPAHLVAKRNARERTRVQAVNSAFGKLRKHVPYEAKHKRLSKVKTLRLAIEYIHHLQELLHNHDLQTAGRCPSYTGQESNESPASSRARRRAKIIDTRLQPVLSVTNSSYLSQACVQSSFGNQAIPKSSTHYGPQDSCISGEKAELQRPIRHCSGDAAAPLQVSTPTTGLSAQSQRYNSCSQVDTAHAYCMDSYVVQDKTGTDSRGNTKSLQVPDNTTYENKVSQNCIYSRNTHSPSSMTIPRYPSSSFRPMYQASLPLELNTYQDRDACFTQKTENVGKPDVYFTANRTNFQPLTLSTDIAPHTSARGDTTANQNYHFHDSRSYESFMVNQK